MFTIQVSAIFETGTFATASEKMPSKRTNATKINVDHLL